MSAIPFLVAEVVVGIVGATVCLTRPTGSWTLAAIPFVLLTACAVMAGLAY